MEINIAERIRKFSAGHKEEIKGPYKSTANTEILTKELPEVLLAKLDLDSNYKVYGSVGKGAWNEIPWIAILDRSITETTTQGYYIAFLFDKDLKYIYLCLAVGWTQFEEEYGSSEGKSKVSSFCNHYGKLLSTDPNGFTSGKIKLGATRHLGKGYEAGQIMSKRYLISDLNGEELINDVGELIESYKELKSIVGDSILNPDVDFVVKDEKIYDFKKKIAQETFSDKITDSLKELIETANKETPEVRLLMKRAIIRNRRFSRLVKERAKYICQVCKREPFMQANGRPYAEADHIEPLGGKARGHDSPDNMRCLCAQCHAILTHGSEDEIKKLLSQL